ncbi:hypothetical protein OTU49_014101, partial [Cherax quadricarinatus]
ERKIQREEGEQGGESERERERNTHTHTHTHTHTLPCVSLVLLSFLQSIYEYFVYHSKTSFLCIRVKNKKADDVYQTLEHQAMLSVCVCVNIVLSCLGRLFKCKQKKKKKKKKKE